MPYCPKCGKEVTEEAEFCLNCGEKLKGEGVAHAMTPGPGRRGIDHLKLAFSLATSSPIVFLPAVLGSLILPALNYYLVANYGSGIMEMLFRGNVVAPMLLLPIGVVSDVLRFTSLKMSKDAYLDLPASLGKSLNYVLRRIGTFILASIVGVGLPVAFVAITTVLIPAISLGYRMDFLILALFGAGLVVTFVLMPVISLMFVIIVVDDTGIRDSLSTAFRVLKTELRDIFVITIVSTVGSLILSFIPFVGNPLGTCLGVVVNLAFIDVYYNYKRAQKSETLDDRIHRIPREPPSL